MMTERMLSTLYAIMVQGECVSSSRTIRMYCDALYDTV